MQYTTPYHFSRITPRPLYYIAMPDPTQLDRIESDVSTIKVILTGNSKPERGLIIRVDRLEQLQKRSIWLFRLVIGGIVIAFTAAAVAAVIKLP